MLAERGCSFVVPAQTPALLALGSRRHFLSNGPATRSLRTMRSRPFRSLETGMPTFGICLGHQIWRWRPAPTFKMKFGHGAKSTQ